MDASTRVFRTKLILRLALAAAGGFWITCFAGLFPTRAAQPAWAVWGCLAMGLFFLCAWTFHARLRITVAPRAVHFRGVRHTFHADYAEVLRVAAQPTFLLTVYVVVTRRGSTWFSSHVAGHRELCAVLRERSAMARGRA